MRENRRDYREQKRLGQIATRSMNATTFLEKRHRFNEDQAFKALLNRLWEGESTKEDVQMLNTRVLPQNGVTTLPAVAKDNDTCYA